jgi:hypothetical protein
MLQMIITAAMYTKRHELYFKVIVFDVFNNGFEKVECFCLVH